MAIHIFPQLHTAPELITVLQAKAQLKLESDYLFEDDLIEGYIESAIVDAENYTNTSIYEAAFLIEQSAFVNYYPIPLSPVQSIESIKYYDASNIEQTLDPALYELRPVDTYQKEIYFNDFSNLPVVYNKENAITISLITGYAAATLPKAIKQAVLLKVTNYYENRNDGVEVLTKSSENLLRKYRFHF